MPIIVTLLQRWLILVRPLAAGIIFATGLSAQQSGEPPLAERPDDSIRQRWAGKPVLAARSLDEMETIDSWEHVGFGAMSLQADRVRFGTKALRLTSPTKGDRPGGELGRPFGEAKVIRRFNHENWESMNRISVWVYPDLPGFRVVSLCLVLHNEGRERVPGSDQRHGRNFVLLKNHEWNQVFWEIAHLGRDQVTGVELCYRLQGHEPGASSEVQFDFDRLTLEKVVPDYFLGWQVAPGTIAYSHSGYALGCSKIALASSLSGREFSLVDAETSRVVLKRPFGVVVNALGEFQVLDFSEWERAGLYRLEVGPLKSAPFRISADVWRGTILKTINLFYAQRCGAAVPGIHDVCHRDWLCLHGEQKVLLDGGWHDAGDLSQGLVNTAEAVYAMLALSERLESSEPELSRRLAEEAKWGLDWVLRTRFGDGFRCTWATMDFWTDGVLGTVDDVTTKATDGPFENLLAASAEAMGARRLKPIDPIYAERCRQAAAEDWQAATRSAAAPDLEMAGALLNAALDLFELTGDSGYSDAAVRAAEIVVACQETERQDWSIPLRGFFYSARDRRHIQHYFHRSHEQAPIQGLVRLARQLSGHPAHSQWVQAIQLYAEYLKTGAQSTMPWGMFPASVYSLEESDRPGFAAQVQNGVKLSETYYLRRFPVWWDFRGNYGVLLSQAVGAASVARYLQDSELTCLCQRQLQWVVGLNPFCQSTMYGEGHDFAPQYSAMSGDLVGGLPVGIQTRLEGDAPYWPAENCYNWKEVWVHPSTRWLGVMCELYPVR